MSSRPQEAPRERHRPRAIGPDWYLRKETGVISKYSRVAAKQPGQKVLERQYAAQNAKKRKKPAAAAAAAAATSAKPAAAAAAATSAKTTIQSDWEWKLVPTSGPRYGQHVPSKWVLYTIAKPRPYTPEDGTVFAPTHPDPLRFNETFLVGALGYRGPRSIRGEGVIRYDENWKPSDGDLENPPKRSYG
jgi:hypothetical protein